MYDMRKIVFITECDIRHSTLRYQNFDLACDIANFNFQRHEFVISNIGN